MNRRRESLSQIGREIDGSVSQFRVGEDGYRSWKKEREFLGE